MKILTFKETGGIRRIGARHRALGIFAWPAVLLFNGMGLHAAPPSSADAGIKLAVPWKQARVTRMVPTVASGREVKGQDLARLFPCTTLEAVDGAVTFPIGSVPVVIESAKSAISPNAFTGLSGGSPLGIHGFETDLPESLAHLQDIGIPWVRLAGPSGLVWDLVEPTAGAYNWEHQDRLFGEFKKMGVKICVVVLAANRWDQGIVGAQRPKSRRPTHMGSYKSFLREAVKRYASTVACWQIENEVDNKMSWDDTPSAYLDLLATSYAVIKENAPNAQVAFAGMSNPHACETVLFPMLKAYRNENPEGTCFDIIDLHWSRQFQGTYDRLQIGGKPRRLDDTIRGIRKQLDALSLQKTKIWLNEISDYAGAPAADPVDGSYAKKSEAEQATSLVKMVLLSLASGADRTFWVNMIDWHGWGGRQGGYFDNVGLVYNPMVDPKGTKKTVYYSAKFLSHMLDGCRFESAVPVSGNPGVRVYMFLRNGEPVYFGWRDPG